MESIWDRVKCQTKDDDDDDEEEDDDDYDALCFLNSKGSQTQSAPGAGGGQ